MLLLCMVTAFLVCTLIVCFVAVIIFSPLVRGGENEWSTSTAEDNLLFRIQQLEEMLQETNDSFKLLQKSLGSLEVSLEVQVRRQSDFDSNISSQFF